MSVQKIRGFVLEWNEEDVTCRILLDDNYTQDRIFEGHMFAGMEMFRGKNFCLKITTVPGTITMECYESEKDVVEQMENFWVHKTFEI